MTEGKKIRLDESKKSSIEIKVSAPGLEIFEGRYQVESFIGSGATSSVYAGHELSTGLKVALKVLHKHLVTDEGIVEQFLKEANTSALLMHPNIAKVVHSGMNETGQPYIAMELVVGKTLREFLMEQGGSLTEADALTIFIQVCAALGVAHKLGVVHRDLKPNNIMVTMFDGQISKAKVLDFGVAKILSAQGETFFKSTQTGETIGSILYMSPEQCLDQDVDARTDIYSLGCVMYEAVTGKPPLVGRTAFLTMNQHLGTTPEPFSRVRPDLHISPALEKIIFTAIAKDPKNRQQTIEQFQDQLVAARNAAVAGVREAVEVNMSDHSQVVQPVAVSSGVAFSSSDRNMPLNLVWGLRAAWCLWWLGSMMLVTCVLFMARSCSVEAIIAGVAVAIMGALQQGASAYVLKRLTSGSNFARIVAVVGCSLYALFFGVTALTSNGAFRHTYDWGELAFTIFWVSLHVGLAVLLSTKSIREWCATVRRSQG